jgi:hypothetical protein
MSDDRLNKETNCWTLRDHRDYAWEYFKVHAQQRMSLFNFFVVFSSLATTCMVGTFQEKIHAHGVGIVLGILLIAISHVSWKLDERVRFFIRHSESALKWIEATYNLQDGQDGPHVLKLFTREESLTESGQPLTYSRCFKVAFFIFALIGLIGAIVSAAFAGWDFHQIVLRP